MTVPIGGHQRARSADRPARRRRAPTTGAARATRARPRRRWAREHVAMREDRSSSIMRRHRPRSCVRSARAPRPGSVVGLSPWERWLELCARIDGFPRHLSIHVGRDARHRGAARRHRAARARHDARPGRRPVRQARRRDDEAHQARPARPADALLDRRRAARHRRRLRGLRRPRPAARGHPRGLPDDPGGGHRGRLPDRVARPDADAAQVAPGDARRPRRRGGDHPARPDPGRRGPPLPAPPAGHRAGDLPAPQPRADPARRPWA